MRGMRRSNSSPGIGPVGRRATVVFSLVMAWWAWWASGCGAEESEPQVVPSSPERTPAQASQESPPLDRRYVAVLVPLEAVDLAAKESGDLISVRVHPGDRVSTGDVIAELNLAPVREALTIARAELRSVKATLERRDVDIAAAERALEIEKELVQKGIGAAKHVEEARFNLQRTRKSRDAAAASVAEKQARIGQLSRRTSEAELLAPFDGAVALRYRDPGTAVTAGTAIIRLIRVDALWARFAVPSSDIAHIARDATVQVQVETIAEPLSATVQHISPELDPATQMVFVDAWLGVSPGLQDSLRAGLPAWVELTPIPSPPVSESPGTPGATGAVNDSR